MIVKTAEMPTKGYLPGPDFASICPITFGELLKFLGDEQLTKVREYVGFLEWMIKCDSRIGDMSILDADYLLYVFKAISSSNSTKLTIYANCDKCNKRHSRQLKLNEIEFYDIDEKNLNIKSIELRGYRYEIRYSTINDFIKFVGSIDNNNESLNIDLLKLASMIKSRAPRESVDILINSSKEDISLINYLDTVWFKLIKPIYIKCPNNQDSRGIPATLDMSAVDTFLDILRFNKSPEEKILFGEIRKSPEFG